MKLQGSETEKILKRTFSGESKARGKYTMYAEKARKEGHEYIAQVFEQIAFNEFAHSREVYWRFLDQVKSTEENLMNSFMGETAEVNTIYKEYEQIARNEGFIEIADFYKELIEVEANHDLRFRTLYDKLLSDTLYKSKTPTLWKCLNCGYIAEGMEAPISCPLCQFPQGWFSPYCDPLKK